MEIKNKLTVTREEWEGHSTGGGGRRRGRGKSRKMNSGFTGMDNRVGTDYDWGQGRGEQ